MRNPNYSPNFLLYPNTETIGIRYGIWDFKGKFETYPVRYTYFVGDVSSSYCSVNRHGHSTPQHADNGHQQHLKNDLKDTHFISYISIYPRTIYFTSRVL